MKVIAEFLSFTGNSGCYGSLPLSVLPGATTFTIEAKFSTTSTESSSLPWKWGTIVGREIGGYNKDDFGFCVNDGKLCFWCSPSTASQNATMMTTSTTAVNDGNVHKAAVRSNADGSIDLYCDGELVAHGDNFNAQITSAQTILIAYDSDSSSYLQMNLHELRFWNVARSEIFADIDGTENGLQAWYLPSEGTLQDYSGNARHATLYGNPAYYAQTTLPVELNLDVKRRAKYAAKTWRYYNEGTTDTLLVGDSTICDLPESQSRTGTAFVQTQRAKCFDLPATPEIWAKFDLYHFSGTSRFRVYDDSNGSTANGFVLTENSSRQVALWSWDGSANYQRKTFDIALKPNTLQTWMLHMKSGTTDGIVELWCDGNFIGSWTGNVNNGAEFANFYVQTDDANNLFSNVIISNAEIDFGEGYQVFSFATERRLTKSVEVFFDVERHVKNVIAVEFTADVLIENVLPVTLTADVIRRATVPVELSADVEILDVIPVEVIADVSRNIKAKFKLYATDNSEYFSGGSSTPIVIPTQEIMPPAADNSDGVQSIEISIGEQQITDQVKIVGINPSTVMTPIQGQFLDYVCDMRVERVQRQGILYTADCCSDIDELLFTPLNYDMPGILRVTQTFSDVEQPNYILITLPTEASKHVKKIANALGLTPIMQFEDFYSSVATYDEKVDGATYADLIRDIFGWSSRVPTQLINVYIRNGKLFVIQRGHESNLIDITDTDKTLPVVSHELVRLFWQRHKFSQSITQEFKRRKNNPTKNSTEIYTDDNYESTYNYDNDGLLKKTVTTTTNKDGETIRTETEYKYTTLYGGKKVLVREVIKKYVNGSLDETTEIKHTPLKQGLSHQVKFDEDGDIIGEGVGQNTSDDRVTPYSQSQLDDDDDETVTANTTIEGLTLIDTSFPIACDAYVDYSHWDKDTPVPHSVVEAQQSVDWNKGHGRLGQITNDIKWLNRRTRETVTLSIYGFPHLIDFNDRIVLDGAEFFLVSNRVLSTPRIYNEQSLTLVRWF